MWDVSHPLHHLPVHLSYLPPSIHRPSHPPASPLPLCWLYQTCPHSLPTGTTYSVSMAQQAAFRNGWRCSQAAAPALLSVKSVTSSFGGTNRSRLRGSGGMFLNICFLTADSLQNPFLLKQRQNFPFGFLPFNFDNSCVFCSCDIAVQPGKQEAKICSETGHF